MSHAQNNFSMRLTWVILIYFNSRLRAEWTNSAITFQKNTLFTMQSFFQPFFTAKAIIWVDWKRRQSYFWKPENHTSNCGQQVGCRTEPQTCKLLVSTCTATPTEPWEMDGFCMEAMPLFIVTLQALISRVPDSFHNVVSCINIQVPWCKLNSLPCWTT